MSGDRGSKKQGRGKGQRVVERRDRPRKKARGTREELGPERRADLAQEIEAKRFRGPRPRFD